MDRIHSFGNVRVCGALHVCWQTKEGASGQYMIALLYREWFCLATASQVEQSYTIQACIALVNVKVEDVDNGRGRKLACSSSSWILTVDTGLQCHTARYSWKIVFLSGNQLYELILTACSPKEELEWCSRLKTSLNAVNPDGQVHMQSDVFSFLSLNIKALGTVFRKSGISCHACHNRRASSLTRAVGAMTKKVSIHRATTIGPKTPLCQVILKNTSAAKDGPTASQSSINRSQSLLTTNSRTPVLAPARAERARLEALLADVWTRDVLPFPGITARSRSEHLVRASASSMMRKLSAVSITGSFTRRSASLASLQLQKEKDDEGARRASDSTFTMATAAAAAKHLHDVPAALSAIADHPPPTVSSSADPDADHDTDGGLELAPRRARASTSTTISATTTSTTPSSPTHPTSAGNTSDVTNTNTTPTPRPSTATTATTSTTTSSTTTASPRPSGSSFHLLSLTDLSARQVSASAAAAAARAARAAREAAREELRHLQQRQGQAQGQGQGQGRAQRPPPPQPLGKEQRGSRLAGRLAKAGGRRREVFVEGLRGWFR